MATSSEKLCSASTQRIQAACFSFPAQVRPDIVRQLHGKGVTGDISKLHIIVIVNA